MKGVLINNNGDILNPQFYSTSMKGVWSTYWCPVCGLRQSGLKSSVEKIINDLKLHEDYKDFLASQLGISPKEVDIKRAIKECQARGLDTLYFD